MTTAKEQKSEQTKQRIRAVIADLAMLYAHYEMQGKRPERFVVNDQDYDGVTRELHSKDYFGVPLVKFSDASHG